MDESLLCAPFNYNETKFITLCQVKGVAAFRSEMFDTGKYAPKIVARVNCVNAYR